MACVQEGEAVECGRGAAWRRAPPPYLLASAAAAAAAAVPLVGLTTPAGGSRGRMSLSIEAGLTCGPKRLTTRPAGSTRNFAKFHLMSEPSISPCFSLRCTHAGWALNPLTSTLVNIGKVAPYLSANDRISAAEPGS